MGEQEREKLRLPRRGTEPYASYVKDYRHLFDFFHFVGYMAARQDTLAVRGAKWLLEGDELLNGPEAREEAARNRKIIEEGGIGAMTTLRTFREMALQVMVCRGVDNFLTYLAQLLSLIFLTKPETLRSNDQIRVDFALRFRTMDDLVDALAERKVIDLSYAGMRPLADYFREKLGLELFGDETALQRAVFLIEVRNLIVHNRAIVNNTFLSRLRGSTENIGTLGNPLSLDRDSTYDGLTFLANIVGELDSRAAAKFGLPQPSHVHLSGKIGALRFASLRGSFLTKATRARRLPLARLDSHSMDTVLADFAG